MIIAPSGLFSTIVLRDAKFHSFSLLFVPTIEMIELVDPFLCLLNIFSDFIPWRLRKKLRNSKNIYFYILMIHSCIKMVKMLEKN
jgi:hypothetical protein